MLEALPLSRSFDEAVASAGHPKLRPIAPTVLQMNVGKRCNQACHHCHVDAGPDRTEVMTDAVVDAVLDLLHASEIPTLDITGGAPELHPRFREIEDEIGQLRLPDVQVIPVSALRGDNVVERGDAMPWYDGPTLLEHLETVEIAGDRDLDHRRFPVQWVIRPISDQHHDYRGYAGQVAGGTVRPGY